MRFATKVFIVCVACVGVACAAQHSYAQAVKGLIYLGTITVGTMWGTKAAEAQQREAEKAAEEKRRAAEAKRRADEEAKAKAERDEADRRLRALEASAAVARAAEEAKAKAEKEAADRRWRELLQKYTSPPPAPPSPSPLTGVGKVYRLGTEWPTSAQYCISFVAGVCSPCDYRADTCDVRFGERLILSEAIK